MTETNSNERENERFTVTPLSNFIRFTVKLHSNFIMFIDHLSDRKVTFEKRPRFGKRFFFLQNSGQENQRKFKLVSLFELILF